MTTRALTHPTPGKTWRRRGAPLLLALGLGLPFAAPAADFDRVIAEQGRVSFTSTQMGVAVPGGFGRYRAALAFDPARPEAGRATVEIDLASVDAGSPEANAELKGANWFHVTAHPLARFESTAFRALGGNRYEARGRLSLRGRVRDVTVPFSFTPQGNRGRFEGRLPIRRLDYGVGQGSWGDTGVVADEVLIQFSFLAEASPAAAPSRKK